MEEINKEQNKPVCTCVNCKGHGPWGCCCCHHHGYFLLRWLLALVILLVVFWLGVKIGEYKAGFGYGYGYDRYNMMNYQRPNMMRWSGGYKFLPEGDQQSVQQSAPATTTLQKK